MLAKALGISIASAVWTLLAGVVSVSIGVRDESLVLIAFGAVSMFDFVSDLVLVAHFRAQQRGRDADHLERVVLRIVGYGLIAVGLTASTYSVVHLVQRHHAESSAASIVFAVVSMVALTALAVGKKWLADRLP